MDTARKTTVLPAGLRLTYAPYLLKDAAIEWAKSGYDPAKMPDIEAIAYRNVDLEQDLWTFISVVDWHKTARD